MTQPPAPAATDGAVAAWKTEGADLLLALPNSLGSVEAGRLRIRAHLEPLQLSARAINRLEVVFEEVVTNIVRHGFMPGSGQAILVRVSVLDGALELTFDDDGSPFNPLDAPPPPRFHSLETARIGGLGIATVRRFCTALAYEASPAPGPAQVLARPGFKAVNRLTATIATTP